MSFLAHNVIHNRSEDKWTSLILVGASASTDFGLYLSTDTDTDTDRILSETSCQLYLFADDITSSSYRILSDKLKNWASSNSKDIYQ